MAVYQEAEEESDEEGAERQAAEAQKLLKSGPKEAFEKPFRKAVNKTPFSGATRQGKSHSRNSRIANGSSKKRLYSEGILRLLKGPGNAGFPGRFFNRILSDPAQLYESLLKISIFCYLRHKRWPKMSL